MREKAVLVSFDRNKRKDDVEGSAQELAELAKAAGLQTVWHFISPLREPNARYFLGSGKVEEIALAVKENEADTVVFDTDLSASQQ